MKLLTFKPPFRLTLTWLTICCNWTQTSRPFADTKANASVFFIFPHRSFFNSILSRHTLHTFASHTNPPHRPKLAKECNLFNAFTKFVACVGGSPQIDGQDDGFLRLSAGGGTNVNTQSSIDITGYSTIADMNNNIVMRTGGTERLRIDNSGNVNMTGKLNIGDPTGNVSTKLVGRVTAGTFLTFDNLRLSVTTYEPRGLSIATVSGTVNLYVEGRYNNGGVNGSRTAGAVTYNTSPSGSPFGWGFISAGDTIIYHLTDPDNSRMYRVTLIIMPSYINNFIAIERLL